MAIKISIDTGLGFKELTRAVSAARDSALRATMNFWHREMLSGHFKAHNMARYGMKKRTEKYKRRKRREGRGQDPNVYTGRMRDKMLSAKPSLQLDQAGATLVYRGLPRYAFMTSSEAYKKPSANAYNPSDKYLRGKHPKHVENILKYRARQAEKRKGGFVQVERPDKIAEVTAVDAADQKKLNKKFQVYFNAALKNLIGK